MIEHIAHLVSRDYDKVPNDLVLLGFVPEGQESAVKSGDSMRVISETYTKLMAGGGAANIDVNAVFTDLQASTARSPLTLEAAGGPYDPRPWMPHSGPIPKANSIRLHE